MTQAPPLFVQSEQRLENQRNEQASKLFHSSEVLSEAYRHATDVAAMRRDADLHELLLSARKEDTYQPYMSGVGEVTWGVISSFNM